MALLILLVYGPALLALPAFLWLLVTGSRPALLCTVAIATLALLPWLFLSWYSRDGIGPGFIPSSGTVAFQHFAEGVRVPAEAWLAVVLCAFARRLARRRTANKVPQ